MAISYQSTATIPQALLAHLKYKHSLISSDVIFYNMRQNITEYDMT